MIFTDNESLEDNVVRLLTEGGKTASELFTIIKSEGKDISIQALYKALRILIKTSVIVKSGKQVLISREWAKRFIDPLKEHSSLPPLAEGESVSYQYNSLSNLDAYWKHLIKSLQDKYSEYPIYIYNPYGIWLHISERLQSETTYLKEFAQKKQYGFLVIGNNSIFDQKLKKSFQNDFLQVDTWDKTSFKENNYFTVVGDYIITTKLGDKLTKHISTFYDTLSSQANADDMLNKILQISDKARIKLEHNSKKAEVLRKKLFKNFYLPNNLKK